MESIGDILKKRGDIGQNFKAIIETTLENQAVQDFIKANQMTTDEVQRSYSKFYEFVQAKAKFDAGSSSPTAGYEPILVMNEGYADVSYQTTAELAKLQEAQNQRRRVRVIGLPSTLKDIDWENVYIEKMIHRLPVYQAISNFIFNPKKEKGLYIYGDFGVGKSYMMAAMANQLAKAGIYTTLIHYPSFVLDIDFDTVSQKVNDVKTADVLVLDDIGGEGNNAWLRDSVLQVILQHRMQENLPTFFTSNKNMQELTQHLAETKRSDDVWAASRVMERIKYLAKEIRLEGVNLRHD